MPYLLKAGWLLVVYKQKRDRGACLFTKKTWLVHLDCCAGAEVPCCGGALTPDGGVLLVDYEGAEVPAFCALLQAGRL